MPSRRAQRGTGTSGARLSHHSLPDGTILTVTSSRGTTIKIQLLPGIFEGHSRNVKVLEAPIEYDDSQVPTIMCVVGPSARIGVMAHAYRAALTDVGPGDTIYLIDRLVGAEVPVPRIVVASVV